jgi:WD40 repeat protein
VLAAPHGHWYYDPQGLLMRLWNIETGRLIRSFERHPTKVTSAVFSPDGTRVVTIMGKVTLHTDRGGDRELGLWDVATGRLVHKFTGHPGGHGRGCILTRRPPHHLGQPRRDGQGLGCANRRRARDAAR